MKVAWCAFPPEPSLTRRRVRAAATPPPEFTAGTSVGSPMHHWRLRPVGIRLRVPKFVCQTLGCVRRIFAEQLAGLTVRHGRHSLQLFGLLAAIAFALAGRAGARLPRRAALALSR